MAKRKRIIRKRHTVLPPVPDDFTHEELYGVPGDPNRRGRAFYCRDDISVRMRIVEPEQDPEGLLEEIRSEFDLVDWLEE